MAFIISSDNPSDPVEDRNSVGRKIHSVAPGLNDAYLMFRDFPLVSLCGRVFHPDTFFTPESEKEFSIPRCQVCEYRLSLLLAILHECNRHAMSRQVI
jgi:hypothetical protein